MNDKSAGRASLVWQLVEKLDEQRRYPRVPLALQAALHCAGDTRCRMQVVNLSPDGLQLRSDVASATLAHPGGGRIDPASPPLVEVALDLPLDAGDATLHARCRLLYLTMVDSEPRYVLGLRFERLDADAERVLSRFFADQLSQMEDATIAA